MTDRPPAGATGPDGLRFVGEVTTRWCTLEMVVKQLISCLLTDDNDAGRIVTWDENWGWLQQHLRPLCEYRLKDDDHGKTLLKDAIVALGRCDERRVQLAHSTMWRMIDLSADTGAPVWQSFKPVGKRFEHLFAGQTWTKEAMDAVRSDFDKASELLMNLANYLQKAQLLYRRLPGQVPWDTT